jgi:hypothetical protein
MRVNYTNITVYKHVVRDVQVTFRAVCSWLGMLWALLIYIVLIGGAGESLSNYTVIHIQEYFKFSNTSL